MALRLRIVLRLAAIGTLDVRRPGNVQGDEAVARAWQKYLSRRDDVEWVRLVGPDDRIEGECHVVVHFNPFLPLHAGAANVLYLQNAYPPELHPGGTAGVFERTRSRFRGFIFTSTRLKAACCDGAVIPFAADPEELYPIPDDRYRHPVAFVGNDIRGPEVNLRYLIPALPFGLVIYGNPAWVPPLAVCCRGKVPQSDLPRVFSSSQVNLNAHIPEHVRYDTVNLRVFEVLASGGFLVSDEIPTLRDEFADAVVCTSGYEDLWARLVCWLADGEKRSRLATEGRRLILARHTYAHRVGTLVEYLDQVL